MYLHEEKKLINESLESMIIDDTIIKKEKKIKKEEKNERERKKDSRRKVTKGRLLREVFAD